MAYWQPQEKHWTPPLQAKAIPIMHQYPAYPPQQQQQQYQAPPQQQQQQQQQHLYASASAYPQRMPSPAPSHGQWMPPAQKQTQNPYGYSEKQQHIYQQYSDRPTPPAYAPSPPTPPSSSGSSSGSPSNRPIAAPMQHYASVGTVPQYGASSSSLYPPRPSSANSSNSAISAPASSEPSTMNPKSDKKFKDKVKDHFVKRDPLNPPPPQFARPPNPNLPYGPFQPFSLATNGAACVDGFPDVYWGAELEPHDVTPEDWTRFLEDIAIMGRISLGQNAAAGLIPLALGPLGMYVQYRVTQKMKVKKAPACGQLVDLWNETFFSQRRIRVVLITPEIMKEAAKQGKQRGEEDRAGKLDRRDQNKCRLYVHPI